MKKFVLTSPQDYLAVVIRRKWLVIIPFIFLSATVGVVTYHLPDVYESETLILVEPREVPDDFVRDLTTIDSAQRLTTVKQTLLSRTSLLRIITEFEDRLVNLRNLSEGERLSRLSDSISVETETRPRRTSYLAIRYQDQDPELAQEITAHLALLLIEHDNLIRGEQISGTTRFIEDELESVSTELERVEGTIAEMKSRYRFELPEHLQTNLRTLDQLHAQLNANTEALDRSLAIRLDLEREISEIDPVLISQDGDSLRPGVSPLVQEFWQKKRLYEDLISRYTAKHPDVQRLKTELDLLRRRIPSADLRVNENQSGEETPNPVYQNMVVQLEDIQREIATRQREREWIQSEIDKYNKRVENTSHREQEMASVLRLHSELTKQYGDLKNKLVDAELAENLEKRQKGENFVIMDPANYPTEPSKPNRILIALVGLFLSLSVGVGAAFALDFLNQKFWLYREVEVLLGDKLLVEIPTIVTDEDLQARNRKRAKYLFCSLVIVSVLFATIYYVSVNPQLKAVSSAYFKQFIELAARFLV